MQYSLFSENAGVREWPPEMLVDVETNASLWVREEAQWLGFDP